MSRPTNQELCTNFRNLLTHGVRQGPIVVTSDADFLAASKDWRNELWQAFREIEARLDPLGAMANGVSVTKQQADQDAGASS